MKSSLSKFDSKTAIAVVVANMIGTGVFTSLGFQLIDIQSGFALLMLWVVGGVTALCGALTYAELGAALPRSGGEYNFLTRCYHPVAGFISGWISSTIGFAAPVALAAITFGAYLSSIFSQLSKNGLAVLLIIVLAIVHGSNRKNSGGLQWLFTLIKLLLIGVFCVAAIALVETPQPVNFLPQSSDLNAVLSGAFAVSLIYVSYAYNGWNAATYLSSELERPQQSLPKILLSGTLLVMCSYVALNFVFLYSTPMEEMVGKVEIGYVVAQSIFGETGAALTGVVMSLLLISTVSAMTMAGPRVLQVIGEDFSVFKSLAVVNRHGIPRRAIYFQSALAVIFVVTSTFESILVFSGFALALNNFFAVLGIFILRQKQPDLKRPYKTWLYPLPPIIFLVLIGWTLFYILKERPQEAIVSLLVISLGVPFYLLSNKLSLQDNSEKLK
ncbi:APC family permease [Aliikangiella coralliicola]|uniref:Amino acid permease n=1 Tax=Aliikangiella coralliicola TaxID=2592383 RepID=A0A545UBN0_9GAMM|nr:amino acid permease [Aliikangiella coralliicola]TQV86872.1 amino acid permease [Aliikangiella coralliicola]